MWNGQVFQKFFIDDSLASKRNFLTMCFDSSGNTWLTAEVILSDTLVGGVHWLDRRTQLIKFDGSNYAILDTNEGLYGYGKDRGLLAARDGRVLVHRYNAFNPKEANLFIYDTNNRTAITIESPHHLIDLLRYRTHTTYIQRIYEDKE